MEHLKHSGFLDFSSPRRLSQGLCRIMQEDMELQLINCSLSFQLLIMLKLVKSHQNQKMDVMSMDFILKELDGITESICCNSQCLRSCIQIYQCCIFFQLVKDQDPKRVFITAQSTRWCLEQGLYQRQVTLRISYCSWNYLQKNRKTRG